MMNLKKKKKKKSKNVEIQEIRSSTLNSVLCVLSTSNLHLIRLTKA